jgi:hypothetical protein
MTFLTQLSFAQIIIDENQPLNPGFENIVDFTDFFPLCRSFFSDNLGAFILCLLILFFSFVGFRLVMFFVSQSDCNENDDYDKDKDEYL